MVNGGLIGVIRERYNVSRSLAQGGEVFRIVTKHGCFVRSPHGWVHGVPENLPSLGKALFGTTPFVPG
jgi:hypothetical protein